MKGPTGSRLEEAESANRTSAAIVGAIPMVLIANLIVPEGGRTHGVAIACLDHLSAGLPVSGPAGDAADAGVLRVLDRLRAHAPCRYTCAMGSQRQPDRPRGAWATVRRGLAVLGVVVTAAGPAYAQTARKPASRPAAQKTPVKKVEPAALSCVASLGTGVRSGREFCDVLAGRDPAEGSRVTLPPHVGLARLTFELHNRHVFSEQQVKAGRAYAEYLATIGVLTLNNDLLSRAAVASSFRTAADLVDRIAVGDGSKAVKAVAPVGSETVSIEIPENVTEVSFLGERLTVQRAYSRDVFTTPGRPIAIVSHVEVEYTPVPPKPAPRKRTPVKKKPAPRTP